MKKILPFIVKRAKESSSWRGLILVVTAFGITINPEIATHIIAAGTAVAGLIGVFVPDTLKEKDS